MRPDLRGPAATGLLLLAILIFLATAPGHAAAPQAAVGVGDYPAFRGVLDRLRGHGLEIAIDDAGSGYSGLEAILQLRPQYIKVANTIVQNLHEETIKRGVITALASVGREIDASLIAEGIEHPEELAALVDLGVNYGQGFLLGRPTGRIARVH